MKLTKNQLTVIVDALKSHSSGLFYDSTKNASQAYATMGLAMMIEDFLNDKENILSEDSDAVFKVQLTNSSPALSKPE